MRIVVPYIIVFILAFLVFKDCQKEPTIITREVTVTVPEVVKHFDTVFIDVPTLIVRVDTVYQNKYINATEAEKTALFEDLATIRDYTQVFQDEYQEISVNSQVRGHLLKQSVDYNIFQRKITKIDTLPLPSRKLYLLPEIGTDFNNIKAKVGLLYIDRGERVYSLSIDNEKYFYIGKAIRF